MQTYRLGSSALVNTPGIVAWAINGYAFEKDRENIMKIMTEGWSGVPVEAFRKLLSTEVGYSIEDDTVVFSVES